MTFTHTTNSHPSTKKRANAERIEADRIASGKTFAVGQPIYVRWLEDAPLHACVCLAMHVAPDIGNCVVCEFEGVVRRVVASRVTKRK